MADVSQYFTKLSTDGEKAQCSRCPQQLSCKGSSTSGLLRHLQNKHHITIKRPISEDQQPSSAVTSTKVSRPEGSKPSMMRFVKRQSLEEIVARLAALDGLSINAITKSEFIRQSISARGMQLPQSNTAVMKLVHEFYNKAKDLTKKEIEKRVAVGECMSLTLDEWTSISNKRYINVNVHCFDGVMYNLGLIRARGSLPAGKIKEAVSAVTINFGIPEKNIVAATTDGAAVMVKFGREAEFFHQLCYNHGLHLAVMDVFRKDNSATFDSVDDDDTDDDCDNDEYSEDETEKPSALYQTRFAEILRKVRKIVKIFRQSPVKNGILQDKIIATHQKPLQLLIVVTTRWNSTESMLERFLRVYECIKVTLAELGQPNLLSDDDVRILKTLLDALQPIRLVSEAIGRRDATLLTAEGSLNFLLSKLKQQNNSIASELHDAVYDRICSRRNKELVSLMKFLKNRHMGSTSELPTCSRSQMMKLVKEADWLLKMVEHETDEESNSSNSSMHQENLTLQQELECAIKEHSGLNNPSATSVDPAKIIQKEMTLYELSGKLTNNLQKLFDNLTSIKPTSTDSERVFSDSSNFCNKKRSSLSDDSMNVLSFLKSFFERNEL